MKRESSINYAIWLSSYCNFSIYGTIAFENKLYYTDSHTDMNKLYDIYLTL